MQYVHLNIVLYGNSANDNQEDQVINLATKFDTTSPRARPYQVITPDTPLEVLEEFLQTNEFALGVSNFLCNDYRLLTLRSDG